MKRPQLNTETTVIERLRLVIGVLLCLAGLVTITIIGALSGYSNMTVWLVGFALLIAGFLIAGSMKLIEFISGFIRG